MPSVTSNIPSNIFYSSAMPGFERNSKSASKLKHFLPVAKQSIRSNNHSKCLQTYVVKTNQKGI